MSVERSKIELVEKALEKLANGFYLLEGREGERLVIGLEADPGEDVEAIFCDALGEIEDELMKIADAIDDGAELTMPAELPLEDNWNDWCLEKLISKVYSELLHPALGDEGTRLVAQIVDHLRGKKYYEVLFFLHGLKRGQLGEGEPIVRGREGLGTSELEQIERRVSTWSQEDMSETVASIYARELSGKFARMVRRAEKLRVLPVTQNVGPEVQRYLQEATKCYIHGHFVASLLICRAAIEFALREFLKRNGREKDLESLKAVKGDTLLAMINLARGVRSSVRPTLEDADQVRRWANEAIHEKRPDEESCKNAFTETRGVLRELYS